MNYKNKSLAPTITILEDFFLEKVQLIFDNEKSFVALLIILVGKKARCIFDQWSKLYFSLDAQPEIQILNGSIGYGCCCQHKQNFEINFLILI